MFTMLKVEILFCKYNKCIRKNTCRLKFVKWFFIALLICQTFGTVYVYDKEFEKYSFSGTKNTNIIIYSL